MDRLERFLTTISFQIFFLRIPESALEGMKSFYVVLVLTHNKTATSTPGVRSLRIWSMASTGSQGDKNALITKLEVIMGPFQLSYIHHNSSKCQGPRHQSYHDRA